MALGTIYSYPDNFRAQKALIAAQYSGGTLSSAENFKFGETNKTEGFLAKFPLGMVPAFEASDGTCLFESNAIAYYVSNEQLRGSNHTEASLVQQWMNFADNEILPPACTWVYPCLGIIQFNKQDTDRSKENLKLVLSVLDAHLLSRTFVVGERVTLADIVLVCDLLLPYQYVLEPAFREPYQNVNRWFTTMINQPQVKAVIGELKFCEKMAQFDGKKYAQIHGQQKKDEKKDKKPKEQPKKVEKSPKKPKEDKKDGDDDDDGVEREPESKDPLDALPKGTFDISAFKRCYSNEDTITKAIPYFWENFDAENYSIWLGEYKYNHELTRVFMSCNLIGGMMQRLEKMKKNAFASLCLFGVDNDSTISGVWVWRGQELAFPLSKDWQVDYDIYEWKKLDPTNADHKKLVNEYLAWEGDFDGKKFNQGKIFK